MTTPHTPDLPAVTHSRHHSRGDLRRAIEAGAVSRVGRDAYLVLDTPDETWTRRREISLGRCVAACDRLAPGVVLSHVSAALLHGLWIPNLDWPVHTTQQFRGTSPTLADEHVRHCRPLADEEVTTLSGLRVTTLERTVIDTITMLPPEWALAAADSALRRAVGATRDTERNGERDVLRREWLDALRRRGPRRGRRHARVVLAIADHRSESPGESRVRCAAMRAGLPIPVPQALVRTHLGDRYVDLGWWLRDAEGRPAFVGYEYDGDMKYEAIDPDDPEALRVRVAEKRREDAVREALQAHGVRTTILRSSGDIEHDVDRLALAMDPTGRMTRVPNLDLLSQPAMRALKQQERARQ